MGQNFKDIVFNMRENLGATQQEFASLLGVSVASVSRWEIGKSAPQQDQVDMIRGLEMLMAAAGSNSEPWARLLRCLMVAQGVGVPIGAWMRTNPDALMSYLNGPDVPRAVEALFSK